MNETLSREERNYAYIFAPFHDFDEHLIIEFVRENPGCTIADMAGIVDPRMLRNLVIRACAHESIVRSGEGKRGNPYRYRVGERKPSL
jgi:hypothetical protein